MDALYLKYRPKLFREVVGQDHAVKSLSTILKDRTAHTFLFSGPSGTGKTTLARIVANKLKCVDLLEIDAATYTGIDDMRSLSQLSKRTSLVGGPKVIVIDECHALSRQAWQSLLKILEEPSRDTYWMLCTTEVAKVPNTIKTRSAHITLKPVPSDQLYLLLRRVSKSEQWQVDNSILKFISKKSKNSPRQALVNLLLCRTCDDVKEANSIIEQETEKSEIIDFCRLLFKAQFNPGQSWPALMQTIKGLEEKGESPEGIRISVFNYFGSVAKNSKQVKQCEYALTVMDCFSKFVDPNEGYNRLILNVGQLLFS